MSSAAPTKRGRSKRKKPPQLKLSFGSASGPSGSLPSTMKANLSELVTELEMRKREVQDDCWYLEDANGNVTGWSPHKYSLQDFETDGPEALDYGPDLAWGQEQVGHHSDDESGDVTGQSSSSPSHRQDLELDGAEAVENGTDSVGLKDPPVVARDAEVLTEADMADIVRRCRAFLEERGPSQEEELCCEEALGPSHRAALVRASCGSLVAFLAQQPGFHHTREGELSFVYYMDPDEEEEDSDATPSLSPAAANATPLLADSPEGGLAEAGGMAEGDGLQSGRVSPCSSPSPSSYVSATDDFLECLEKSRDACTQTAPAGQEEAPGCCGRQWQCAQKDTHDRQTQINSLGTAQLVKAEQMLKEKIRVLEAKIAAMEDEHSCEIRELRLALEALPPCGCQQRPPSPLPPPPPKEPPPSLQEVANVCAPAGGKYAHRGLSPSTNGGGGVTGASPSEEEGSREAQSARPAVLDGMLTNGIGPEVSGAEDGRQPGSSMLTGAFSKGGETAPSEEGEGFPSAPVAKPIQAEGESWGDGPSGRTLNGTVPRLSRMEQTPWAEAGPLSRVPDSAELHWRLEHSGRANSCADLDSAGRAASRCGSVCSTTTRSKSEAQIAKIVRLLRKQLPHCSETNVRAHVDHVRRLQGGFSRMTIGDIVSLVLNYVRESEGQQER